jgi:nucleotide-binding universal stress UspA family protein
MRRVLVGMDGSPQSAMALRWAHHLLAPCQPQIVAAHAWEPPGWHAFVGDQPPVDDELTSDRVRATLRTQIRAALPDATDDVSVRAPGAAGHGADAPGRRGGLRRHRRRPARCR